MIRNLAYIGLTSPNAAEWRSFGPDVLGAELAPDGPDGAVRLRVDDAARRIAVHPGDVDDLAYLGWDVDDLDVTVAAVEAAGATVTDGAFTDPFGFRHELGRVIGIGGPFTPGRTMSGFVTGDQGLGHVVLIVPDLAAAEAFYVGALGLRLSDSVDTGFTIRFFHCAHRHARHHTMAIAAAPGMAGLHHLMLEVATLDDVGTALDVVNARRIPLAMSLGRHTNDQMTSFYVRTPSGFEIEYGTGGLVVDDTTWQETRYDAGSIWGHRPPADGRLVPSILRPVGGGDMSLVDDAKRLAPELATARTEGDELRRLPDGVWKQLLESGILRALQPARWGGGEVHLVEFVDAIITLSAANPSAGWVAGVIGVHPWQLALFDDRAQQELWADDPTTMHSSSYNPTGRAAPVDGGYRVSGRWSFSSGCDHCRAVNLGAVIPGGQIADFRSFLLTADQYRIDDNWHVAGLKGTGSKDIVVDDAFVPAHRTQSHLAYASGVPLPGQERNDGPLYRLPWSVVFNMALAASVLGSARGFLDTWIDLTRDRSVAGVGRLANDPLTQRRLADAVWDLDAAAAMMRADAHTMWDMAEAADTPTMADRARMRWNVNRGCERVAQAAGELMRAASGRSIYLDHPLQARFQDLQGALGHAFLIPDAVARAVGGTLLGTDKPELVL